MSLHGGVERERPRDGLLIDLVIVEGGPIKEEDAVLDGLTETGPETGLVGVVCVVAALFWPHRLAGPRYTVSGCATKDFGAVRDCLAP